MDSPRPPRRSRLTSLFLRTIAGDRGMSEQDVRTLIESNPDAAPDIRRFAQWLQGTVTLAPQETGGGPGSVVERLEPGVRPRVRLPEGDDGARGSEAAAPGDGASAGRYRLHDEIGRGGVGVVYRGEDVDLGRRVALKFLHEHHSSHPGLLGRFLEEAQIGAQLQHPGIVPVYDMGRLDGRPFFAMRLVKGETLSVLLARRASPLEHQQRHLSIFEQVCRTVGYAHARGVLHRDLKPDNILVGPFGEVQVVDWGLAKVLGAGPGEDRTSVDTDTLTLIETVRSRDEDSASMAGSLLGTPAYMAPEQAAGLLDELDAQTDVFALGAILCEVLTGLPPYVSREADTSARVHDLVRLAAGAKLDAARARLADSGADRQLIELCERCLSPARGARPQDASEVAEWVSGYLATVAERAESARRQAREAKQRQRWMTAVAATFVVGCAASSYLWSSSAALAEANGRLAREKSDLAAAEASARKDAIAQKVEADKQRRRAERNLERFTELKYVVLLRKARSARQGLHPPWPERLAAMDGWLQQYGAPLVAVIPALSQTVSEVRERAIPRTEQERQAERESHPRHGALLRERDRVRWIETMERVRQGAAVALPELDASVRDLGLDALNALAWERVAPDKRARKIFGEEPKALAAAQLLVQRAAGEPAERRARFAQTLAWANFAVGRDDAAKTAMVTAVELAPDARRPGYEAQSKSLADTIARVTGAAGVEMLRRAVASLEKLDEEVDARRHWRFGSDEDDFLHETLTNLVADLRRFETSEVAAVRQQKAWAEQLVARCYTKYAERWGEARRAIIRADGKAASTLYAALSEFELTPQAGLVPIGANPRTGLWEFYHLASAADPDAPPPAHAADGRIEVTADTGIVFVLLPGGTRWLGAQAKDRDGPNFDATANLDERPYRVRLDPYFIARHEMTQGQWKRLSGETQRSRFSPGMRDGPSQKITLAHPVEMVSWEACDDLMRRFGLDLPTEAQWEFAARAGTDTPWWTGAVRESLVGGGLTANLADQAARRGGATWAMIADWPELDDGYQVHAPVDAFRPNPWGLHHVHGNVYEWCRDLGGVVPQPRDGDGLREVVGGKDRCFRGGGFDFTSRDARASARHGRGPTVQHESIGLRPVRAVLRRDFNQGTGR